MAKYGKKPYHAGAPWKLLIGRLSTCFGFVEVGGLLLARTLRTMEPGTLVQSRIKFESASGKRIRIGLQGVVEPISPSPNRGLFLKHAFTAFPPAHLTSSSVPFFAQVEGPSTNPSQDPNTRVSVSFENGVTMNCIIGKQIEAVAPTEGTPLTGAKPEAPAPTAPFSLAVTWRMLCNPLIWIVTILDFVVWLLTTFVGGGLVKMVIFLSRGPMSYEANSVTKARRRAGYNELVTTPKKGGT